MAFKAAIFDIDGTILDSMPQVLSALCEAYRKVSGKRIAKEKFKGLLGEPLALIGETVCPGAPGEFAREFNRIMFRRNRLLRLFPGVKGLLKRLRKKGVKRAVVSGIGMRDIRIILEANKATEYFDVIITAGDFPGGKRSGRPFKEACRLMKVPPEETVAAGDTSLDCIGAKRAGCLAVGIGNALHPASELRAAGADKVLKSVLEIEKFL